MTGGQTALFAADGDEENAAAADTPTLKLDQDRPKLKVVRVMASNVTVLSILEEAVFPFPAASAAAPAGTLAITVPLSSAT